MFDSLPDPPTIRARPRPLKKNSPQVDDLGHQDPADVDRPAQSAKAAAVALAKRGLRIGRTRVGKGLFATKRIVDGSCIGEIKGQVINDDDYVSRYAFDLNGGDQLEPDAPFRFVNHSCEPNCAFELFSFPRNAPLKNTCNSKACISGSEQRKLLLFAICDIAAGQELTIDYNWPAVFAIPCSCRSATCRGWIVTPKDLSQLIDEEYFPR